MPRSIEAVAKEAAEKVVRMAEGAGYGIRAHRACFFRNDLMSLENDIAIWLSQHMAPEPVET